MSEEVTFLVKPYSIEINYSCDKVLPSSSIGVSLCFYLAKLVRQLFFLSKWK